MAGSAQVITGNSRATPPGSCWAERARAALERRFATAGELTPRAAAETVAAALPAPHGRWLLRRLASLGWLRPEARVPFDVLDGPDCPADLWPWREVVRLAVFGLPGQGLSARDKRREALYQQLCAQIMSGAVDTVSLEALSRRALNHPEVGADPVLSSMLRSFISQRETVLRVARTTPEEAHQASEEESKLRTGFSSVTGREFPSREQLVTMFGRLHEDFDRQLAQFDEKGAERTLNQMRDLRRRYPVHVAATELQRCEEQYDRLLKRAGVYRRQIEELAHCGSQAADEGDERKAHWVVRRLQAIHALLPTLLPADRFEALQAEIMRHSEQHELQEAAQALREREQEVVVKIKNLAGIIHRFHQLADSTPHQDEAYRRAELNYRRAVAEIRKLDTDWLSSLVIQLETLIEDLDDPDGKMQTHLDRFIASVRSALNRLCLEIRSRQQHLKRAGRSDGPSRDGPAQTA